MQHQTGGQIEMESVPKRSWVDPIRDAGIALTNWTMRFVPDPWVIAVILSIVVFLMAMAWGEVNVPQAIGAWGKGFWALLTFMAEFTFTIMVAYACAAAPIMARLFDYISTRPNPDKPWQAVFTLAVFTMVIAWINWAASITMSALLAIYLAKNNPKTDFRLLVCTAYLGFATMWASGITSTAPLLIATPDNFLLKAGVLKELIPVTKTILTPVNFVIIIVAFVVLVITTTLLTPRPEKAYTLSKEQVDKLIRVSHLKRPENPTFAQKMNWWPGWNILMACACIGFMTYSFVHSGFAAWTIDMYNLSFLILALVLTMRPAVLFDGFKKGVTGTWGILSQFPIYGGIFGLIVFTNLGKFLTHVFASFATPATYLHIVYYYSGILSYFVPSAGSKWAIEAAYILPAGHALGISTAAVTLAYTWGDMLTHLIQPFWAIAILDITETRFGEIAGFSALIFVVYAILMSCLMFLIPLNL
jgi:short-chain fatty acids transporter